MKENLLRTTLCKVIGLDEDNKEITIIISDGSGAIGFVLDGNYPIDFCPEQARREEGIFSR